MMKLCVNLLILCAFVSCSASVALGQRASKASLNPPRWILGSWSTSAVANTDDMEEFAFTSDEISFTEGFLDKSKLVAFSREFADYKVKETIEPRIYRVEFYAGKNEFVYEFKLCEVDACKTFSGKEALTYSIIQNKKIVRSHSTSINLVLFRPISGK